MDGNILSSLAVVQSLALLATAYYSHAIYAHDRLSKVWLAFTAGVLLLGVDKLVESFLLPTPDETRPPVVIVHILFTLGYFLVLGGIRSLKMSFENFEHIEKKTREKITAFGEKTVGKKGRKRV